MTQNKSIVDALLEQTADIKGAVAAEAAIAHLKANQQVLIAALTLARGELKECTQHIAVDLGETFDAIDEALALAKSEPQGLSRLNAGDMAGEAA